MTKKLIIIIVGLLLTILLVLAVTVSFDTRLDQNSNLRSRLIDYDHPASEVDVKKMLSTSEVSNTRATNEADR